MRKRKTPQARLREKAVKLAHELDDAARDMVSGRSFAATQLRRAAKLLHDLAKLWQEQEDATRGVKNEIVSSPQRVRRRLSTRKRK